MIRRLLKLIKTIRQRINERRLKPFLFFAATGLIAIAAWLGWPSLMSAPYVRVQNSSFVLVMSCAPENVAIYSRTQYASLTHARLILQDANGLVAGYPLTASGLRSGPTVTFVVPVTHETRSNLKDAERQRRFLDNPFIGIALDFVKIPSLDLTTVSITYPQTERNAQCQSEALSGTSLAKRVFGSRARTMYYYLIHDALSDSIFLANEFAGNILLACLVLALLWLVTQLAAALTGVFLVSDDRLTRSLKRVANEDAVHNAYSSTHRRLAFSRMLGPALGFLLTVSSLVAGLHPSATSAKDTFQFVSSLQLALVATFMGLAVRIIAEFVIRFERDSALRKLDLMARMKGA